MPALFNDPKTSRAFAAAFWALVKSEQDAVVAPAAPDADYQHAIDNSLATRLLPASTLTQGD